MRSVSCLLWLRFRKPRFQEGRHYANIARALYSRHPSRLLERSPPILSGFWSSIKEIEDRLCLSGISPYPFYLDQIKLLNEHRYLSVCGPKGWLGRLCRSFTKVPYWSFGVEYTVFFFSSVRPFFFSVAPLSVLRHWLVQYAPIIPPQTHLPILFWISAVQPFRGGCLLGL